MPYTASDIERHKAKIYDDFQQVETLLSQSFPGLSQLQTNYSISPALVAVFISILTPIILWFCGVSLHWLFRSACLLCPALLTWNSITSTIVPDQYINKKHPTQHWAKYWLILAISICIDTLLSYILHSLTLYRTISTLFFLIMLLPPYTFASTLFDVILLPFFIANENSIISLYGQAFNGVLQISSEVITQTTTAIKNSRHIQRLVPQDPTSKALLNASSQILRQHGQNALNGQYQSQDQPPQAYPQYPPQVYPQYPQQQQHNQLYPSHGYHDIPSIYDPYAQPASAPQDSQGQAPSQPQRSQRRGFF